MKIVKQKHSEAREGLGLFLLKLLHKYFGIKKPWEA